MNAPRSTATPNPEALLAEEDFVRSLARSLLRDPDAADDLVQGTWVRALEAGRAAEARGRRRIADLRAWLATVAKNLARTDRQAAARRSARERAAARPEAVPPADAVLAYEAERRRVVDAVLGLSEPYRTVILARFFEELSPRAIARREGRNVATVRSQIHRGLALLRRRLDEQHGGERGAWAGPLGASLIRRGWLAAGVSGVLWTMTTMTVKKTLLSAAVLALLVAGATWAVGSIDSGEHADPVAPAMRSVRAGKESAPELFAPAGRVQLGAGDDAPVALRGTLVRHDGSPAAGVPYLTYAEILPEQWRRGVPAPDGSSRTRADGGFEVVRGGAADVGLWFDVAPGVLIGWDVAELHVGDALALPELTSIEVAVSGIDAGERWRLGLYPAWRTRNGGWNSGLAPRRVPERDAAGRTRIVVRRGVERVTSGSRVESVICLAHRVYRVTASAKEHLLSGVDARYVAPAKVVRTAVRRLPQIVVEVVDPGTGQRAQVDGRIFVGPHDGDSWRSYRPFEDGAHRFGWKRLERGERYRLWLLLGDGEFYSRPIVIPDAGDAGPVRLVRGTGQAPLRLRVPPRTVTSPASGDDPPRVFARVARGRVFRCESFEGFWFAERWPIGFALDGDRLWLATDAGPITEVWLASADGSVAYRAAGDDRLRWLPTEPLPELRFATFCDERPLSRVFLFSFELDLSASGGEGWEVFDRVRLVRESGRLWLEEGSDNEAEAPAPKCWLKRVPAGVPCRIRATAFDGAGWFDVTPDR